MRWLALWLALSVPASAGAYVRTTTKSSSPSCPGDKALPLFWYAVTIPYVADEAGSDDISTVSSVSITSPDSARTRERTRPPFWNSTS